MRCIVGLCVLILSLGTLLCRIDVRPTDAAAAATTAWVRTVDGWERPESWRAGAAIPPPPHPLVVAAAQGMVSLFALLALDDRGKRRDCC